MKCTNEEDPGKEKRVNDSLFPIYGTKQIAAQRNNVDYMLTQ